MSMNLPPFLLKLHKITQGCDPTIAGWNELGTIFEIHSDLFVTSVLKLHFKGSKNTFIRQLHFYGFKKLERDGDANWAFSHPKFLRDSPHLIYEIKRKTRTEDSGPASKDEVQALRTEVVKLGKVIETMQQQMAQMRSSMDMMRSSSSSMGLPKSQPDVGGEKGSRKRLRGRDDSLSDTSAMSALLPFEDSYANAESPRLAGSDSDDFVYPTLKKEKMALGGFVEDYDFDANNLMNFSDVFLGPGQDYSSSTSGGVGTQVPVVQQQQQEHGWSANAGTPPASVDSDYQKRPVARGKSSGKSKAVRIFDMGALHPNDKAPDDLYVVMVRRDGSEKPMTGQMFAGFMAKFVEHSILLHRRNMLHGAPDAELEEVVKANLPKDSLLKDLMTHVSRQVRTVLVNVLSEVPVHVPAHLPPGARPTVHKMSDNFLENPFLVFKGSEGFLRVVKGQCYTHFLNFLLRAAVVDDPRSPPPSLENLNSPFFGAFARYFSPQVLRVMCNAHTRIQAYKEMRMADATAVDAIEAR